MSRNFQQHPELYPQAGPFPRLTGTAQEPREPDYFAVAADAIRAAGARDHLLCDHSEAPGTNDPEESEAHYVARMLEEAEEIADGRTRRLGTTEHVYALVHELRRLKGQLNGVHES